MTRLSERGPGAGGSRGDVRALRVGDACGRGAAGEGPAHSSRTGARARRVRAAGRAAVGRRRSPRRASTGPFRRRRPGRLTKPLRVLNWYPNAAPPSGQSGTPAAI